MLDKLPKKLLPQAREVLCKIPYGETREAAGLMRDAFAKRYRKDHPKAVACLFDDRERMVTFYLFPREHWRHLRTTNVVESRFAPVRLRMSAAKRFK